MLDTIFENITFKDFIDEDDIGFIKELIKVSFEKWHTLKKYRVLSRLKYAGFQKDKYIRVLLNQLCIS